MATFRISNHAVFLALLLAPAGSAVGPLPSTYGTGIGTLVADSCSAHHVLADLLGEDGWTATWPAGRAGSSGTSVYHARMPGFQKDRGGCDEFGLCLSNPRSPPAATPLGPDAWIYDLTYPDGESGVTFRGILHVSFTSVR